MAKLSHIKFLLTFFFLAVHAHLSLCMISEVVCIKEEGEALLKFASFSVNYVSLLLEEHAIRGDCCEWLGVVCSKTSGHVIKLDLNHIYGTSSRVDQSLLDLKHLYYLDLSNNDFQMAPIPTFIGDMKQLKYLDLSHSSFSGRVPPHLGNLTELHFLDIGSNYALHVDDPMEWIYNLSSLRNLDMSLVNLRAAKAINLMKVLNTLPFLKILFLYECQLHDAQFFYASKSSQISKSLRNSASLEILDLSNNSFICSIPSWIGNITSLIQLNLAYNQFDGVEGGLLSIIRNTCHLNLLFLSNNNLHGNLVGSKGNLSGCIKYDMEYLELRSNKLNGSLSNNWLGQLKKLRRLDLSSNLFSGPILENLGQLRRLEELRIQNNYFEGDVSEVHFANLSQLRGLMIGNQHLVNWKIRSDWVPPFNLDYLSLQYLNTNGSKIPQWLRAQKDLYYLDLSYSDITGTIPTWLEELSLLSYLDLSNNQLKGSIPQSFGGLEELYLARNQINGSLPTSLCKMKSLFLLDISENRLSGSIPNCWFSDDHQFYLTIMSLSSNQLSGVIPNSLENLHRLEDLRLGNNHFHGEIPSFANCSSLRILDLGRNQLSGKITAWMGNGLKLQSLVILRLRENKLTGNIPSNLCRLRNLRILDLANNNITGTIPPCLGYLPGMMGEIIDFEIPIYYYNNDSKAEMSIDKEIVVQVIKGREFNYSKIGLKLFVNMDLSNNKLVGFIPVELTQLTGLIGLNLSHNNFSGMIPTEIGRMKGLESLDLSCNILFGPLPIGMLNLTSLEVLNLSYNNLSGRILQGNQFSTLNDPFSYIGNPYLCGDPLPNSCNGDESSVQSTSENGGFEDEDNLEKTWLCIITMLGYASGFWGVVGVLIFKKRWRYAYFQFADEVKDRIYVKILVNAARLKKLVRENGGDDE